jgi:hypothetical protein
MLDVLGIKNASKLVPMQDDQRPRDPVTENMAIINGKPVKAFEHQDHEAHIKVHLAFSQDPKLAELIGQNPQAQAIVAAGYAHLNEHIAFEYKRQIQDQLGVDLPKEDQPLPEDIEGDIARLTATAAEQLLQKSQSEAQQQQAQQQAQDPLVQMQQQELQLKGQEIQIKAEKAKADIEIDKAKIQVDMLRIQSDERKAGAQIGLKGSSEKAKLEASQQLEGVKLGVDLAKTHTQNAHQTKQLGHQGDQLAHQKDVAAKQHALSITELMQAKAEAPPKPTEGA